MTDEELVALLEKQRSVMVAVATGGPRIDDVSFEYRLAYSASAAELGKRGISNPNPYSDLWEWYGRWSTGDLPSYQSRRQFLADMFHPTILRVKNRAIGQSSDAVSEPTGWPKVDRMVGEIRKRLAEAQNEEHFQTVGLLCREALISLAQAVYDRQKHPSIDTVLPSDTDAKRMLEAYLAVELYGPANEVARRHARGSVDLAVELQHRRTLSANMGETVTPLEFNVEGEQGSETDERYGDGLGRVGGRGGGEGEPAAVHGGVQAEDRPGGRRL